MHRTAKVTNILKIRISLIILILFGLPPFSAALSVTLIYDHQQPRLSFAAREIEGSLLEHGHQVFKTGGFPGKDDCKMDAYVLLATLQDPSVRSLLQKMNQEIPEFASEEGFQIVRSRTDGFIILGKGAAGTMYGGLEFAEQVMLYGLEGTVEMKQEPYMRMRGSKFNIPLDVRTPSYSDVCDAAQQNIEEMWSMEFWKEYLDRMARYRYNFISLWNLHPFPSMIRVPDYPDVALDDVMKSNGPFKENYPLEGTGFDDPSIMQDLRIVKKMTMDEKIGFWREVMAYGKSRNIDFYVVTWNIFVYGTDDRYGITDDIGNEVTKDYFRKSVEQMFLTYPDLAGIGLTTGENFGEADFMQKEEWVYATYAKGTMDAAAKQPGREITFLHRQHMTGALEIAEKFNPLIQTDNIHFLFSFKYAKAHVFSSIYQPFCNQFVEEIHGMKTIWTLRNDDNYYFRWGGAHFVRDFIRNIPYDVSEGFYYGSDQYIWGREFLTKSPELGGQLEVSKHWYHWLLWGRLGFDPTLTDQRFIDLLGHHFEEVDGEQLFNAWQSASMIYPRTTGFHWGALDFQWYIEGCKSRPGPARTETGFHDVHRFISLPPHPGTNYQGIPEYVAMLKQGGSTQKRTPLELAEEIHALSDRALEFLDSAGEVNNRELGITLDDIRCMAYLGKYYACKIEGATRLHMCMELTERMSENQQLAVDDLTRAASFWKKYAALAGSNYQNPLWTNRVGIVDWDQIYLWVLDDIEKAKDAI
jgi:hypothetical protein